MDDLAPSAVTPVCAWEQTPSQEERKGRRHPSATQARDEETEEPEQAKPHSLDELA